MLLRPSDAAKLCGLSDSQIRRLIKQGFIKAYKVGAYYIIDKKDIKHLKRRRKLKTNFSGE